MGFAALIPPSGMVAYRHLRVPRKARALAIAQNRLTVQPVVVALILGASFLLVDSLIGGIIGLIAGDTAAAVLDLHGTHAQETYLLQQGLGSSLLVAAPLLIAFAILAGRRASHYIQDNQFYWLFVAAAFYWLLRMLAVLAFRNALSSIGITLSIGRFALFYAATGILLALASWAGALWGRRSNDAFVGGRMLAQLPADERQAALDLLRDSVKSQTGQPKELLHRGRPNPPRRPPH